MYSGCCSDEIIQGREGYKESPLWWPQGGGQRKVYLLIAVLSLLNVWKEVALICF